MQLAMNRSIFLIIFGIIFQVNRNKLKNCVWFSTNNDIILCNLVIIVMKIFRHILGYSILWNGFVPNNGTSYSSFASVITILVNTGTNIDITCTLYDVEKLFDLCALNEGILQMLYLFYHLVLENYFKSLIKMYELLCKHTLAS